MPINYKEIEKAVKILGLPEKATFPEIKNIYKELITKWHPDKCKKDPKKCLKKSRQIIKSYKILQDYCQNYKYSFTPENLQKQKSYDELWAEQFGEDPLWGYPKKEQ